MLISPEFEIYEFKIHPPYKEKEKSEMYDYFINKHVNMLKEDIQYGRPQSYAYIADGYKDKLEFLYDTYLKICNDTFGKITLTDKNSRNKWVIVTDNDWVDPRQVIHDHMKTSDINAAYYFSVPDTNSGQLYFYDDDDNEVYTYQPTEGSLLIFPCYLKHSPTGCNSNKFRITLNMEILCEENVWKKDYK